MSAHKWWRVSFPVTPVGASASTVQELRFLDSAGAALSLSGGSALASSQYSASYSSAKAFDNSTGTYWMADDATDPGPVWLAYMYSAAVDVAGVKIRFNSVQSGLEWPRQLALQCSADGVTWVSGVDAGSVLHPPSGVVFTGNTDYTCMVKPEPAFATIPTNVVSVRDLRLPGEPGIITENTSVKRFVAGAEQPMPGALVSLHELQSMRCVWKGVADQNGNYHPPVLSAGFRYVPVAVDPSSTYECVAAGPVTAVAVP